MCDERMHRRLRRSSNKEIRDSNNNVLSETDRAPIELSSSDENSNRRNSACLSDGTKATIGDIVWIKHNKCLDTPVIVENILKGKSEKVLNGEQNKHSSESMSFRG